MAAGDLFGLDRGARRPRLSPLRAVPRREAVTGQRHHADRLLPRHPDGARLPARGVHGAGLLGHAARATLARRARARLLPARRHEGGAGAGLEAVRGHGARLHGRLRRPPLRRSSGSRGTCRSTRTASTSVNPWVAMNTTASFVTNTNWQYYGGEYTMSYLSQMAGLAVQNFVSAALGMAVLAAVDPRLLAPVGEHGRQLLGRPLPVARLHPPAARARSSRCFSSRRASSRRSTEHATATTLEGAQQAIARGPAASADRDQAARDERWRVLQLELGRPLREPERLHEPARDARDPADPGRLRCSCSAA